MESGNVNEVINIFNKMYNISKDPKIKKDIAEIYWHKQNDLKKAYELYKKIEKYFINDIDFLWLMSDLYKDMADFYHQTLYMQKAIKLEIEKNPNLEEI